MQDFTLFPHQQEGVSFLQSRNYCILGDEMGLGKTLTALCAAHPMKTIIICPASLRDVWALELESRFPERAWEVVTSKSKVAGMHHTLIVSYEQMERVMKAFPQAHTVVLDEAHYLKNPKAARTKVFLKMLKNSPPERCFMLTGTPIKNHVPEIYTLLQICSYCPSKTNGEDVLESFKNQTRFCEAMCHYRTKRIGRMMLGEFYGLKDAPLLRRLLKGKYLGRKLHDVMTLPPLTEHFAPVAKLEREKELREAFLHYQKKRDIPSPVKVQTAIEKSQFTVPLVRHHLEKGDVPLVVFSDHREPARVIHEALKQNYSTGIITGDVPVQKRSELIRDFQSGVLDVLICTIGAASVGVTLTASNTLILNDPPWCPADLRQAIKRIHRIGTTKECRIIYVTAPGFDRVIMETIARKSAVIEEALG